MEAEALTQRLKAAEAAVQGQMASQQAQGALENKLKEECAKAEAAASAAKSDAERRSAEATKVVEAAKAEAAEALSASDALRKQMVTVEAALRLLM